MVQHAFTLRRQVDLSSRAAKSARKRKGVSAPGHHFWNAVGDLCVNKRFSWAGGLKHLHEKLTEW